MDVTKKKDALVPKRPMTAAPMTKTVEHQLHVVVIEEAVVMKDVVTTVEVVTAILHVVVIEDLKDAMTAAVTEVTIEDHVEVTTEVHHQTVPMATLFLYAT